MATRHLQIDDLPRTHRRGAKKWLIISLIVLAVIAAVAAVLLAINWPFTRKRVTQRLQEATASTVRMGSFKAEYFPHPGCVAEQVTFQKAGTSQPLMTVRSLSIRGSFFGLFTGHVSIVQAEGTHIALPALGTGPSLGGTNHSGTIIDQLVADGAVLDILPKNAGAQPTRFLLRRFELRGLGGDRALSFQTVFENPKPPGEVSASGSFGPWKSGSAASTPVSGRYAFRHADLSVFRGIAGMLSSDGTFRGTFHDLQVQGTTDTPDFEAAHSGHKFRLSGQFRALVDATNADVTLENAAALLGHTTIAAQGRIARTQGGQGKTASLDFAVRDGRIDDILLLFVKDPRSPLMGITSFRAHVTIPPGRQAFVRKVQLQGEFGIGGAKFTNPKTEKSLTDLSLRARGQKDKVEQDPARVLSGLNGQVALKNGVATFSNLSFTVPGARAKIHGTYNLVNERINLHGLLRMDSSLSNATSGIKSFLLKALGPFLKSNHRGEVLPVGITGTYAHPSYHMSPQSRK
ncbi:MAG TPA: AsmA-like C-terminal region-containing protein [Terriglobales bacterium]|nr:AsmA-like C-terminal region-containing protein [Terriglobales bacterium]